jgi:hypothetical protein
METMALNAVDTRKWARTETDASSARPVPDLESPRTREDEQRFQQTAPGDGNKEVEEDEVEED